MHNKEYIVIVQCHIVMERCSGYFCEKSYYERSGEFSRYPENKNYRTLYLTCGGCCGRAVFRKLTDLIKYIEKSEGISKDKIIVHLASCITKDNYHAPVCPHLDYLKELISGKLGMDIAEGTKISELSEKRRKSGQYKRHC